MSECVKQEKAVFAEHTDATAFHDAMCVCAHQSQPNVSAVWLQGGSLSVHLQRLLVATCVVVKSSERGQDVHLSRHLQRPAVKGQRSKVTTWLSMMEVLFKKVLSCYVQ